MDVLFCFCLVESHLFFASAGLLLARDRRGGWELLSELHHIVCMAKRRGLRDIEIIL